MFDCLPCAHDNYQGPTQMTQQHQMHLYLQQQQQLRYGQTQQAQGITSNGTPANINAVRSPMVQNSQLAGNVARPSPLRGNTPQTSRSPMPPQQPGVVAGQHPQQPATVQQMPSQPMYNYAAVSPYVARMTAMSQNPSTLAAMHALQAQQQAQAQSQPQQPSQTPHMQAATPEQQQAQAQAHAQALQMMSRYPMFNVNYAQMGVNMPMQGGLTPAYQWTPAMGFRRPVNGVGVNGMNAQVNGQAAQMSATHAQQMQRAMQGSVQGR